MNEILPADPLKICCCCGDRTLLALRPCCCCACSMFMLTLILMLAAADELRLLCECELLRGSGDDAFDPPPPPLWLDLPCDELFTSASGDAVECAAWACGCFVLLLMVKEAPAKTTK